MSEEEVKPNPVVQVELFRVGKVLSSGKTYPKELIDDALSEVKMFVTAGRVLGEFDPDLSKRSHVIPNEASHRVKSLYYKEDLLMADLEISRETPRGQDLITHLKNGGTILVKPRAIGNFDEDGVLCEYRLVTIDIYSEEKSDLIL